MSNDWKDWSYFIQSTWGDVTEVQKNEAPQWGGWARPISRSRNERAWI